MKRLDFILNGKGGVGKSFFAVNFVQFLKDKGIAHVAIDSDNENSTLKRFHPDTRFLDLDNRVNSTVSSPRSKRRIWWSWIAAPRPPTCSLITSPN
jgi:cellulose biosynthesis protein BcsQ